MYEFFINNNKIEFEANPSLLISASREIDVKLNALFTECGGISIGNGLYRVHSFDSSQRWNLLLNEYFPKYEGLIIPFGYDWFGRQYGIVRGLPDVIFMFDPSMIEEFQLAIDISDFHNKDLVKDKEETISESAFHEILQSLAITKLKYKECIGYKRPLFLGGKDEFTNYEVQDIEVYWQMQYQMFLQIKKLPEGTKIQGMEFRPDKRNPFDE